MSMNTQGRPTGTGTTSDFTSVSGSSLLPNEPLLFEIGDTEHSGVDLPDVVIDASFLGGFERKSAIDLAGLTEPEAMPVRSDIVSDNPVPTPPFWGTRIVKGIALADYAAFVSGQTIVVDGGRFPH